MDFDFSSLDRLVVEMGTETPKTIHKVRQAVEVSAVNVKKSWQKLASSQTGAGHASAYPRSIDYDLELNVDGAISAEIGPDLAKRQGALGILEDAPGGVKAHPQHNDRLALALNIGDFERGVLKATERTP